MDRLEVNNERCWRTSEVASRLRAGARAVRARDLMSMDTVEMESPRTPFVGALDLECGQNVLRDDT